MIIFLMLVETIVLRMQSIGWNREQMSSTQMILIGIYRLLILGRFGLSHLLLWMGKGRGL